MLPYLVTDETKIRPTTAPTTPSARQSNVECYEGTGANYQGSVSQAYTGQACADWSTKSPNFGKTQFARRLTNRLKLRGFNRTRPMRTELLSLVIQ